MVWETTVGLKTELEMPKQRVAKMIVVGAVRVLSVKAVAVLAETAAVLAAVPKF
jgi:hypothetical protein